MGVGHVALDYYLNQESPFRSFPVCALLDPRPAGDRWIPVSAASATALSTGVNISSDNGKSENQKHYPTLFDYAKQEKKSTGVIATSSLTYPIPAAFITSVEHCGREHDIAYRIFNSDTDVLLGGGSRFFKMNTVTNTNLIPLMQDRGYTYISQQSQLDVLNPEKTEKILGLFADEALRKANYRSLSLTLMMEKAVAVLEKNKNGFVLVVDGSQIDWRAHERDDDGLLTELHDFSEAINWAVNYQKKNPETLIVMSGTNETGGIFLIRDDSEPSQVSIKYNTSLHTANLCPIFAKGPGEDRIGGIMSIADLGKELIDFIRE